MMVNGNHNCAGKTVVFSYFKIQESFSIEFINLFASLVFPPVCRIVCMCESILC